jgi:putative ABC transport system ATP-binding protein
MPAPVIDLREVSKSYAEGDRERVVLDRISACLSAGQITVVVGRSGSGKSTLLNLIGGIDVPSAGEVWVGGTPIDRLSETERTLFRRRRIGFVFQSCNLVPTLTVIENLVLPLELNGWDTDQAEPRALQTLEELGLAERAASFPNHLSGGEQQRVAIARALVHDPDVLLADEPTGNLDQDTGRAVIETLERLVRRVGKTLVVATHSREVMARADRTLTLDRGRLMDIGASAGPGP